MDDIFGGADIVLQAQQIQEQLLHLCTAGGFPLQKWTSNCKEILKFHTEATVDTTVPVEIEPSLVKLLGLFWQPSTDTYHFVSHSTVPSKVTKRTILSEIAQLFDPLGLLSPIIVQAKMFLQELWMVKFGWDELLSPKMQARWNAFRQQLQNLQQLSIPRWISFSTTSLSLEIHGFSDVLQLAMAAAIYLRVISSNGETTVTLVCSKTRIAPLKKVTIPRLELSAALLLVTNVQRVLELSESPVNLWTDSSVTLTWITLHPSRWKEYIRNRVSMIQELTPPRIWRYVPGKENPADCATRGLQVDQLAQQSLWWNGPPWLIRNDRSLIIDHRLPTT